MRTISSKISWTDNDTGIVFEISDSITIKSAKSSDETVVEEMKRDLIRKNLFAMNNFLAEMEDEN